MGTDGYLLGIDIGSGGCKVSLLNRERQETFTRALEYPTYFPRAGWAEQDAEDWTRGTGKLIRELLDETGIRPSRVRAVGIGGVSPTLPYSSTGEEGSSGGPSTSPTRGASRRSNTSRRGRATCFSDPASTPWA
jgi:ribulose kinase